MVENISSSRHTARKEHTCNFCGGIIRKGEAYQKDTCVGDGHLWTWKSHELCLHVSRFYYDLPSYDGVPEFHEWESDYLKGCASFMFDFAVEKARDIHNK